MDRAAVRSRALRGAWPGRLGLVAFQAGESALADFRNAGQGADVLAVLLERGRNVCPSLFPLAVHQLDGLGESFLAFGQPGFSLSQATLQPPRGGRSRKRRGACATAKLLKGASDNGYYVKFSSGCSHRKYKSKKMARPHAETGPGRWEETDARRKKSLAATSPAASAVTATTTTITAAGRTRRA
jgi:hypothetical protein